MTPPTAPDIVWTAAVMWCIWHKAVIGPSDELDEVAENPRLESYFTPAETEFLESIATKSILDWMVMPASQFVELSDYLNHSEIIWTILWSASVVTELTPDDQHTTEDTLALFAGRSPEDIVYEARRRPTAEIVTALEDLKMARQLQYVDHTDGVAQLRINALEWVLGKRERI